MFRIKLHNVKQGANVTQNRRQNISNDLRHVSLQHSSRALAEWRFRQLDLNENELLSRRELRVLKRAVKKQVRPVTSRIARTPPVTHTHTHTPRSQDFMAPRLTWRLVNNRCLVTSLCARTPENTHAHIQADKGFFDQSSTIVHPTSTGAPKVLRQDPRLSL